jgi:hypothetical protein
VALGHDSEAVPQIDVGDVFHVEPPSSVHTTVPDGEAATQFVTVAHTKDQKSSPLVSWYCFVHVVPPSDVA